MSAGIYSAFPLVLFNSNLRDKLFGNLPRVFSAGAEETDECEGQGADEVDKQVLHGIKEPNIQIPAEAEALSVDGDIGDVVQEDWNVAVCWVQHDAGKTGDYGVLLHIHTQQPVHGELEEFPQHTDGHGKAERYYGKKCRRKVKMRGVLSIEDIYQRIADGSTEETPNRMRHSIPMGKTDVIARKLTQDLTGKNMNKDTLTKAA